MEEDFVVIYEFQLSFEEFKEYANKSKLNNWDATSDEIKKVSFPVNELLNDNNIYNYNEFEVGLPNSVIGTTISDKSPNTFIAVKVYVKKQYEQLASEIINNQLGFEEPDELKEYEPIEDDES